MATADNSHKYVSFVMGGINFEYDEAKNQKILRNMEFLSKAQLVYFLTTIELNYTMKRTV